MDITVEKLTDEKLAKNIIGFMTNREPENVKTNLYDIYKSEHSPIYSQIFMIKLESIPSFVSVHLTRHSKNGCSHYVSSARSDITGTPDAETNRLTPVNHLIIANAKHIIDISRKRLCQKASAETREIWQSVVDKIGEIDGELYDRCVPECQYRGGCYEIKSCGWFS